MSRDRWQDKHGSQDSQIGESDQRPPLDVDDDRMWSAARRTPPSADALDRIAFRVKTSREPPFTAARWRVWAAASLLLLVGGAAGAAVATFVIKRPMTGGLIDAEGKRARAWTQLAHNRSGAEPPSPQAPSPPAAAATGPATKPAPAQTFSAPMQLAMRGPAVSARVQELAPTPKVSPPLPVSPPPTLPLPPVLPPPTGAGAEARILRSALTAAHRQDDPAAALTLLDQYDALFPKGRLRAEAMLARAYSLRRLGRDDELLRLLERMPFADMPREAELRLLLGELLMPRGRYAEAAKDFEATLAASASDGLVERALLGRAACRSHLGDSQGARADLTRYLERFPAAPRAAEVRASLAR
jgi:hypothetical protein